MRERLSRRDVARDAELYSPLNAAVLMSVQERERAMVHWLREARLGPTEDLRLLEIGCGAGRTLLDLLRLGFSPQNMVGNELMEDRLQAAAAVLPNSLELLCCDALDMDWEPNAFDVVVQSTVFTSIGDPAIQAELARRMWRWTRPGGGVLWYDFTFNNPANPDVKGIPFRLVKDLFPEGAHIRKWRLTLAPPISRLVTRIHPCCYTLVNALPLLRTHVLCWIQKP